MKKKLLLVLSFVFVLGLTGCKDDEEPGYDFDVPAAYNVNLQEVEYSEYLSLGNPVVTINVKDMGEIVIQLFPTVAPNTVNNFIKYIQDGAYDSNEFHKVINGGMIQGGLLEDPRCTIVGEFSENDIENDLSHVKGVLSMSRAGEFYNTANSQFFIIQSDALFLDGTYAGFGGMISGFNIVDYITSLNSEELGDLPITPIYIDSITIELNGYVPEETVCFY